MKLDITPIIRELHELDEDTKHVHNRTPEQKALDLAEVRRLVALAKSSTHKARNPG
jgi:hypothetical protein